MKSYTDGELIKDFLKKKETWNKRQKSNWQNLLLLEDQQILYFREYCKYSQEQTTEFVSLAMDESLDVNNTSQLLIFIWATTSEFDIKEPLDMIQLNNEKMDMEVKTTVLEMLAKCNIWPEKKITAFTTNGNAW